MDREHGARLECLRLLGRADHLRVLAAAEERELLSGHPLDYPSHLFMREIAANEGIGTVREYLERPGRRGAMLARTVERLRSVDLGPLRRFGIDPGDVRNAPGAALRAARALLPDAEAGRAGDGIVQWAGHASFAALRTGTAVRRDGRRFTAAHELAASVLARRHYALSVPGHPGFLYQPASIEVVAAGYGWLAEHGERAPGLTPGQRHAGALLREIPHGAGPALELFAAHELGHTLDAGGHAPVLEALRRTGHDPADAFRHGLTGPRHLAAWDRLAAGRGGPAERTFDVTFVLSDLLAAWTRITACPDGPASRLQVAYLWQLAAPPGTPDARRGTAASLRAAERVEPSALAREIEEILAAARTAPHTVGARFEALEARSWDLLRERFPQATDGAGRA
ncbi:hypothetical protein [Actinomadura sp. WMMB 499]|uniref:hypothetical protein n=1 Tax=Actinomadura sp. WMMB 499 TaxID=1219491 RepID=UPI0012490597|nr:hypothetical protein [Actinomadura sp. WMMB 499]QFG20430.1 hypothetical protein F7P10_03885 [Actinomadura sp. WMMB 499]